MNYLTIFCVLLFLIVPSAADINITVQSENNKTLSIVDLQSYNVVGEGGNNQTFSDLPYSNYEVRLLSDSDITVDDAVGFFQGTSNKLVYFAIMVGIVSLLYSFARSLAR